MGVVFDRSQEHLATSDIAIIAARQRLLNTLRDLERGIEPYAAQHSEVYGVRALDAVCAEGDFERILDGYGDRMVVPTGTAASA